MAGSIILLNIPQLQEQRKGFEAISITNFDTVDTTTPQIALGSRIEVAGSVVQFTANESILGFAGLGVGIAYAYIDGVALTANWTATAPTWSNEKQAYYDVTGANRYFMRCEKDAGGNYLHKALYTNIRGVMRTYTGLALNTLANGDQEIRFATDASILWDESENEFVFDKTLNGLAFRKQVFAKLHFFSMAAGNKTQNDFFDAFDIYVPNTDDILFVNGWASYSGSGVFGILYVRRTGASTITLNTHDNSASWIFGATNGSALGFANANISCFIVW